MPDEPHTTLSVRELAAKIVAAYVVNGGAKAGHCGGVKVGQSQCEWSR